MRFFFIPASGYRTYSLSQMDQVTSYGYYWSSTPRSAIAGYCMNFHPSRVDPQSSPNRTGGYSVRPVQE